MNQQQPPQTPPNQQVPDHRIEEMQERMRQLELQNAQLRTTLDMTVKGKPQGQGPNPAEAFKPEVAQAIKSLLAAELQPLTEQFRQQIGMVYDQVDEARFMQQYGNEKFQKFHDKVSRVRQDQIARGNYITREQALQMVYLEETGKKAAPEAPVQQQPPAPKQPVFDPYFGAYVDPDTGLPIKQTQGQEPQFDQGFDPADGRQQPTQAQIQGTPPPWQQQAPQAPQQPPAPQGTMPQGFQRGAQHGLNNNHPHANPYGVQRPQLPNQGIAPQGPQAPRGVAPRVSVDLESSDADLKAFEDNFGDIPL